MSLPQLSSLSSLQILKLEFFDPPNENLLIHQLPKLASVKQLELRVGASGDASLLPLTLLIKACPCLRSFVLKLTSTWEMLCGQRELKRVVRPPHRHLKEVEFYNYYGQPCDHELVNYLVENAIALEKLVVNPCDKEYSPGRMKRLKEPRERALQQLKGKLPSRIELVIN
ncbi:uncharacterized protein LOC115729634 [Rhodamnia argentea]|uniref:Uncharacterized protein LOC115729634 n=1 Tax=Rhodamnia argentea TaxID=178133 RepID=A0ABM3HE93_9MYRT|nr:uncharacterized protein LOC115729634 [Rhodamnia argentea]